MARNQLQRFFFIFVNRGKHQTILHQESVRQLQPLSHHRRPARMAESVLVEEAVAAGVVWRVDVDALDALAEFFLQEVERLPVFRVDQQAVGLRVEVVEGGVGEDFVDQRLFLVGDEQAGVDDERGAGLEVVDARHGLLEFALEVVDQARVLQQARPVAFRNLAHGDEPVGVDDLFLEREQVALEGFGGVEEVDNARRHAVEGAGDDAGGGVAAQVEQRVEVAENDILDEAVFLATQEGAQVLVDEVVGVLPDIEEVELFVGLEQGGGEPVGRERRGARFGVAPERLEGVVSGDGVEVVVFTQAKLVDALGLPAFGLGLILTGFLEDRRVVLAEKVRGDVLLRGKQGK